MGGQDRQDETTPRQAMRRATRPPGTQPSLQLDKSGKGVKKWREKRVRESAKPRNITYARAFYFSVSFFFYYFYIVKLLLCREHVCAGRT